jgi:hypothetical protein
MRHSLLQYHAVLVNSRTRAVTLLAPCIDAMQYDARRPFKSAPKRRGTAHRPVPTVAQRLNKHAQIPKPGPPFSFVEIRTLTLTVGCHRLNWGSVMFPALGGTAAIRDRNHFPSRPVA